MNWVWKSGEIINFKFILNLSQVLRIPSGAQPAYVLDMSWSALSNQFTFLLHSSFVEAEPNSFQSCCWKSVVQPFSLCISIETSECSVKSGYTCASHLLLFADSCSCFFICFCKQSEAAKITSKTNSENLQDSFQSAGCPRAAGRLLPEPGGLVLS